MKEFYIEEVENWIKSLPTDESCKIVNLSNWNPSTFFMNQLAIDIPYLFEGNPISYIFSSDYSNSLRNEVLKKWGYSYQRGITFFNTGSESILNTLYLLLQLKCRKLYLLCPTYFSIEPICNTIGIECEKIYLIRQKNRYFIPKEKIRLLEENSCLWITNPVYCTGTAYLQEDISFLKKITIERNIFLVNDESLCIRNKSLCNYFESLDKYFHIITPHKALCTNALKFSAVIYSNKYELSVDKWADTLQGCLGIGANAAIKHYLSKEFDLYEQSFMRCIKKNRMLLLNMLKKYNIDYDKYSESYLVSIFFKDIAYDKYDDIINMKKLIYENNAFIITGSKNAFPFSTGFSFRINLCAFDPFYLHTLERTLLYLNQKENTL